MNQFKRLLKMNPWKLLKKICCFEEIYTIGENGITEDDILTHDAHCQDSTLHFKLGTMCGPEFPVALGVIRDVEAPTYEAAVEEQIAEVQAKRPQVKCLNDFFKTLETWEIK